MYTRSAAASRSENADSPWYANGQSRLYVWYVKRLELKFLFTLRAGQIGSTGTTETDWKVAIGVNSETIETRVWITVFPPQSIL